MGTTKNILRWYLVLILYIFGLKKASTRVDKTDRFTPQNSNNFATSLIPLTPPFKGFVRFIRYVTLHSLRFTSFVSLCFIRFALLRFNFIHFASFRQALPDSTRFAHSVRFASLHSFRFAPLIPFHSTHSVSLHSFHLLHPMKGVIRSILWSFFIVSVLTRSTETLRLELYLMKETSVFDDD